ncbi:hypothetical protein UFOVP1608_51 [uncultured Caudovirales phage]|uniref:Uncharacterized protein n=1 Tax=uncultured Caudovirales phage TaxID=2100421 RepID=A0A6J5SUQ1_9CAUD|nr:hypothetical protein UFOVP1608_51 [uncultured Caudovirales phage]
MIETILTFVLVSAILFVFLFIGAIIGFSIAQFGEKKTDSALDFLDSDFGTWDD